MRTAFEAARVHALGIRDAELLLRLKALELERGARATSASGIAEHRVARVEQEMKAIGAERMAIVEVLDELAEEAERRA